MVIGLKAIDLIRTSGQFVRFLAFVYSAEAATSIPSLAQRFDYNSPAYIQFQKSEFTIAENETNAVITVTRTGDFRQKTTVDYQVSDGTAVAGEDYKPVGGRLVFAPFENTKTFLVPIISGRVIETNETIRLSLLHPGYNALIVESEAILIITDAPPQPLPPPPLAVGPGENGIIVLSWSGDRLDCSLERTDDPISESWTLLAATPYEMEGRLIVEEPASNNAYFYRLRSK